jgi:hypothetical protein
MSRKKLKSSEKVAALRAYVKKKHHPRVMEVIKREIDRLNLEELTEKTKGVV